MGTQYGVDPGLITSAVALKEAEYIAVEMQQNAFLRLGKHG